MEFIGEDIIIMAILDSKVGHIKSRISKDRVVLKTMYPFKKES